MKIRNPILIRAAAFIVVGLLRLVFGTCRFRYVGSPAGWGPAFDPSPSEHFLYSIWHDSVLIPIFSRKKYFGMATLASEHRDAGYLVEVLKLIGITAVRGSASRGGARAARQLMRVIAEKHICITPDGPRGPARRVKPGVVFLASRTGAAVVPTGYGASRYWRIGKSWTHIQLPKPFSTVYLAIGEPIRVPGGASREELRAYTRILQAEMDRYNDWVERLASGDAGAESAPRRAAA